MKSRYGWIVLLLWIGWAASIGAKEGASSEFDWENPPQGVWKETWSTIKINGEKAGYSHEIMERDGDLIRSRVNQFTRIGRQGAGVEIKTNHWTEETVAGEPRAFGSEQILGTIPITTKGTIADGKLKLTSVQFGQESVREIDWAQDALMTWAGMLALKDMEMAEGVEAELSLFMPDIALDRAVLLKILVEARDTIVRAGEEIPTWRVLYRIGSGMGGEIAMEAWVDDYANMYRTRTQMGTMLVETELSSSEEALADFTGPELFEESLLWVSGCAGIERANSAVYEITFIDGKTREVFPQTLHQTANSQGEGTLLLCVSPKSAEDVESVGGSAKDLQNGNGDAAADSEYLESNFYLNYEDNAMAELVAELEPMRELSPAARARALTEWVSEYVSAKNYDVGFATAAEVARTREGDCTEHAVLLAALGRALGLPSRVASGLVLVPTGGEECGENAKGMMGFHMWTQFRLNGDWYDYDATLAPERTLPTLLLIGTSSLQGDVLYDIGMQVVELLGNLQVRVVELDFVATE